MWQQIVVLLPSTLAMLCTVLAFLIPFLIYKFNRKLHQIGDPAWKRMQKGIDEKK